MLEALARSLARLCRHTPARLQCWWVQSVFVSPTARRQGVYKALYAHVVAEARAAGAAGVRLYADVQNTRAHDTYRALGMHSHYVVFEDMFTGF